MDELGIPFDITIDFETKTDKSVTLRERDSCEQIRLPMDEVANTVRDLSEGHIVWADLTAKYPTVKAVEEAKS